VKNRFKHPTLKILFLVLAGIGLLQGCKENLPLASSILAPPLPNTDISNFQNASLKVNPTLLGGNPGIFLDGSYAYTTDSGLQLPAPTPSASNPYGGTSPYALHLFGNYIDYNNLGYPAFEMECFPRANASYSSGNMYDVTPFSGISFWWNQGTDDNANQLFFCLVTARIAPQSIGGDGTCGTGSNVPCYDYLGDNLLGYPKGGWFQVFEDFSSMTLQYGSGGPTNVTALDKQQVLQLLWTSRSNNNGNTSSTGPAQNYTADFWVDDIQFYP
jgi:hypothetical protein